MKKIVYLLILMFSFMNMCLAAEPAKLVYLTNRCSVVSNNEVTIYVDVISTNDGFVTQLTDRFVMGRITNRKDMIVSFSNVESDYTTQVILDTLRDGNERSNLNVFFDKDITLKKEEKLLSFIINIEFSGDVPSSLYVLGNEILLSSDETVCEFVNGYKTEVIRTEIKENVSIYFVISGVLAVIVLVEFIVILRTLKKR